MKFIYMKRSDIVTRRTANYEEALRYYKRAELIEKKAWTLKKIGLCLRRLGKN